MLCHGTDNKWANHARQRAHTIGNTHEDTGIAWSNVQMVDIEALTKKGNPTQSLNCECEIVSCTQLFPKNNKNMSCEDGVVQN